MGFISRARRTEADPFASWRKFAVNKERLETIIVESDQTADAFSVQLFDAIKEELGKTDSYVASMTDELRKKMMELTKHITKSDFKNEMMELASPTTSFTEPFFPSSENSPRRESSESEQDTDYPSKSLRTDDYSPSLLNKEKSDEHAPAQGAHDIVDRFTKKPVERTVNEHIRHCFVGWYSSALHLISFCQMNISTVEEIGKLQLEKRPEEGDLTDRISQILAESHLNAMLDQIQEMTKRVKMIYEANMGEPLQRYENVDMRARDVWTCKFIPLVIGIVLFIIAQLIPVFKKDPAAHQCFALFVIVITYWITEAIPFFCTALLIPLIVVRAHVIIDPNTKTYANATRASKILLGSMFGSTQILVMGGLAIGKALARAKIDTKIAGTIHKYTYTRPRLYFLFVMLFGCLVSMVISNVASPVLLLGVIQSTLWQFPDNSPAPKTILLGLAFACNIGGTLSPTASPQNAVGQHVLQDHGINVSFGQWVAIALPLSIITVLIIWVTLDLLWKPFKNITEIPHPPESDEKPVPLSHMITVVVVSAATLILWIIPDRFTFGDTGTIALIPIVIFFGSGILKKEDFNALSWHLMFLLAGGTMIGKCAKDSRMLDIVVDSMRHFLSEQNPHTTLVLLVIIFLGVTTLVSHTVSAMIMLPVVAKIGVLLPKEGHWPVGVDTRILLFVCIMMCSAAMAFPVSSFPNVNSLLAENAVGRPYLKAYDYLLPGIIVSTIISLFCLSWLPIFCALVFGK